MKRMRLTNLSKVEMFNNFLFSVVSLPGNFMIDIILEFLLLLLFTNLEWKLQKL